MPDIGAPLLESAQAFEPKAVQLGFVAGTIPVEKLAAFERLLFRATRGNMFLKFTAVSCSWASSVGFFERVGWGVQ